MSEGKDDRDLTPRYCCLETAPTTTLTNFYARLTYGDANQKLVSFLQLQTNSYSVLSTQYGGTA